MLFNSQCDLLFLVQDTVSSVNSMNRDVCPVTLDILRKTNRKIVSDTIILIDLEKPKFIKTDRLTVTLPRLRDAPVSAKPERIKGAAG